MIADRYLPELARVFTPSALHELGENGRISRLDYILTESGVSNSILRQVRLTEVFDRLYRSLLRQHRIEYVYKNAIVNKWLLGRHSLNTSTLIPEFRVNRAKVDIVFLNSSSHAIEIKTPLDDVSRLSHQLTSYRSVFSRISVITCENLLHRVRSTVGQSVGIYILTGQYTIREIRQPSPNLDGFNPREVVASLRCDEYTNVLSELGAGPPDVPSGLRFERSASLMSNFDPSAVERAMLRTLKKRDVPSFVAQSLPEVPHSLKTVWLLSDLSSDEVDVLQDRLEESYCPTRSSSVFH